MSAILILVLRALMIIALYGFVGWALFTLWQELHLQTQMVRPKNPPSLKLYLVGGAPAEDRQFTQTEIILGRDPACDFPLSNETVSTHHAKASFHHNQWWIEDMRSTNGTYLNDQKVELPTVLVNGDELRCGQVVLEIGDTQPAKV